MKYNNLLKFSTLGIEFATTVLVFVFIGLFLDKKLNTLPLFTLLLMFFGFGSAVYLLYKASKRMQNLEKENYSPKDKNEK